MRCGLRVRDGHCSGRILIRGTVVAVVSVCGRDAVRGQPERQDHRYPQEVYALATLRNNLS